MTNCALPLAQLVNTPLISPFTSHLGVEYKILPFLSTITTSDASE